MSKIIAGRFQEQSEVELAIEKLQAAGFGPEQISSFFVNPAGQHDMYPIGGDHALSHGAKETDTGVTTGAVAGAIVGAATAPILGPIGAVTATLVGAHVGGLIGGLSSMKERDEPEDAPSDEHDPSNTAAVRRSGMMVAVSVGDDEHWNSALNVLQSLGAVDLEQAEGTIENGDWSDFDPVAPPHLLDVSRANHAAR